ncbi:hypothetical protein [Armatimonas rosea]|uniref:DUF4139 domain-containing protein n=1 Tax=Armatimonas rosea TaxID=685828 RepID=A0A7W9W6B4_ARMRO|nr:hypothetical protein [Armatimonas rosea]MBB6049397.1 hypothetical protein [Armatimonas rosea]
MLMKCLALVFWIALVALPVAAQPAWTPRVQTQGTELRVNDVLVLRARSSVGGIEPTERIQLSAERLKELTQAGLEPREVRVDVETETRHRNETRTVTKMVEKKVTRRIKKKRRTVTIEVPVQVKQTVDVAYEVETEARLMARGKVLATATPTEAQLSRIAKPSLLVEGWAGQLRKALAIPGIALSETGQIVPWMEKRTLKFSGAARGPVVVQRQSGPGSPVEATVDLATSTITLTGKSVGRDILVVSREGASDKLTVAVQPYAAALLPPQPVVLTGSGVEGERVAKLVLASARAAIQPLAGASIKIESEPASVPPPGQGKSLSVPISVSVSGPEMLPVRQSLKVPVVGRSLPKAETNALFFSNSPERVKEPQTLYVGRLSMGTARLLYHHLNNAGQTLWFVAELVNDSDSATRVQVLGNDAGPVRDTVWVGYRAASDFMSAFQSDSGMVVEIPAHSRMAFQAIRLPNDLILSGLFQLRLLSGSAPLVRVAADLPGSPQTISETLSAVPLSATLQNQLRELESKSPHVYPKPGVALTAKYSVGSHRWGFFSVGRAPLVGTDPSQILEGNYGVFYDIQLTLDNPTTSPAEVRLIFEPAGGMAGAVFVIDGKRAEIPQTSSPETTLATFRLAPGARKVVPVRTLPLSGSNYPINLFVKS